MGASDGVPLADPVPDDDASEPDVPVVDAATARGLSTQHRNHKRVAVKASEFWAGVLGTEQGRAEIHRLLSEGGAFRPPFAVGPSGFPQPEATWFQAGQQAFVLGLYQRLLAYDLDGVRLMLMEHDSKFKAEATK